MRSKIKTCFSFLCLLALVSLSGFIAPMEAEALSLCKNNKNIIKIIGQTADGRYPIYQLRGDLSDFSYQSDSPDLVWRPSDLLTRLVYLDPNDVNKGYECDWICKDEKGHVVGLNPILKKLPR